MSHSARLLAALVLLSACHGGQKPEESSPAEQPIRPLAQLAAQRTILTPTYYVAAGDGLGWSAAIPRTREFLRALDDALAKELGARGLRTQWIYPADLVRDTKSNPTYAADPYALGVNVLRDPNIVSGTKIGDPLVTQLRTMVALEENARAVLVPVELSFPSAGTGKQAAVLRVALLDGRLGDVRWVGVVRSDPASAMTPAVIANLATRFADLVTAP
ncbi:MAG TPA: hypothetical protein VF929_11225 [Gemmatimonadaceae bacterium]